jgi:hypothetical protein
MSAIPIRDGDGDRWTEFDDVAMRAAFNPNRLKLWDSFQAHQAETIPVKVECYRSPETALPDYETLASGNPKGSMRMLGQVLMTLLFGGLFTLWLCFASGAWEWAGACVLAGLGLWGAVRGGMTGGGIE